MSHRSATRAAIAAVLLSGLFLLPSAIYGQPSEEPITQEQLFDDQRLLDIHIELAEEDWQTLRGETLEFVTAFGKGAFDSDYTWFPADISVDGRHLKKIEVRKKGFFGSMDQVRPSLKVKIEDSEERDLLGGLERLTLNNNKQDRAHVSQILAYRLFREAGLPAPRCSLAQVIVNGQSLGIYAHVESIEKAFLQRNFGSDDGNLCEGVFPTDFLTDRLERFEIKQGKKKKAREDLRRIAELLENPPEDLAEQLNAIVDLDQFITHWALESLIGFWDGYASNQNNYYLYQDPRDSKWRFIPWGADMTLVPPFFPGGGSRGGGGPGGGGGYKSVYAKGLLAYHLNQDPQIRQRYQDTMLKLLDTVWREAELLAEVDRIETLVRNHLHEAQGGIEQPAETTRTFIKNRRQEIMDEIQNGPVHVTTPPSKSFYIREAGVASATFSAEWSPAEGMEGKPSEEATLAIEIDGEPVVLRRVTATAGPSRMPRFGGFGAPGPPPPTIVLSGVREADQKKLTLTITFPADGFRAAGEPIAVQGMLMEGEMFMFGGGMRSFAGRAELTSAQQEPGGLVAGSLSGKLYEMRGGFGR